MSMQGSKSAGQVEFLTTLSGVSTSPKWSFKGRTGPGRNSDTPGPGAYTSQDRADSRANKSPSFGFGTAPRDSARHAPSPGPGQYTPGDASVKNAKYGFGTSTRGSMRQGRWNNPGPGSYSLTPGVGNEGPKYTAGGKRGNDRNLNTPGPGAYQPGDSRSNVHQSPKWGFGTSPREVRSSRTSPGPGAYNAAPAFEGPKYTMSARRDLIKQANSPGPGAHGGPYTQFGY